MGRTHLYRRWLPVLLLFLALALVCAGCSRAVEGDPALAEGQNQDTLGWQENGDPADISSTAGVEADPGAEPAAKPGEDPAGAPKPGPADEGEDPASAPKPGPAAGTEKPAAKPEAEPAVGTEKPAAKPGEDPASAPKPGPAAGTEKPAAEPGAGPAVGTEKPAAETEHPLPVDPGDVTIGDQAYTCTLEVRCDTILDNLEDLDPEKVDLVPEDAVIFPTTTVTFYEGESVFDLLQREMKQAAIHMEYTATPIYNSSYIEGIGNLYELDCGPLSGWMYQVNGWYPNYGSSRYQLQQDDVVIWRYTCDLGQDLGTIFNQYE